MKAHEANLSFATSVGADSIPATFNHGRGVSFEGIEPMGHEKDDAARDADLKRTTDQRNEHLETVWEWKRNDIFDLATRGEIERLIAASEEAERAVYQREIVERAYYEHKRTSDLTADDWHEIVSAITDAGYDAAGKEATPDWAWFVNAVLPLAQCQCDESIAAALNIRNAIMKRIRESEVNEAVVRKLSGVDVRSEIMAFRTDVCEAKTAAERAANGVDWLVTDRKNKTKQNKERGKSNQAKGNDEERKRAARDMETALNRVHDRMKNGAKNVLAECRTVCKRFTPMGRKNELGFYPDALPLTGEGFKPIKAETLAKNYRKRFGTKKAHKAKMKRATKPKQRTK